MTPGNFVLLIIVSAITLIAIALLLYLTEDPDDPEDI